MATIAPPSEQLLVPPKIVVDGINFVIRENVFTNIEIKYNL